MGFKSATNIRNVNQSNGNYEVDDLIFPSRLVFTTFESLDSNLKFLYTPGFASNDYETINHSPVREDDGEFDVILERVEERIERIKEFRSNNFLYKEKRGGAFFEKFPRILDCINEGVFCLGGKYKNNFERRIGNIVRILSYIGIDPYRY